MPWHRRVFWRLRLVAWLTHGGRRPSRCRSCSTAARAARGCCRSFPLLRVMALAGAALRRAAALLPVADRTDRRDDGREEPPTPEENIEALIAAGTEEGLIDEDDRKLIQSVVEFGDKLVREVMTPRPNIVAISADATLEQLRQLVINEQYSRIPVYEENIDQVIGFVHVRDMFELEEDEREHRTVRDLMRPIRFVPETKPVNDLMREMQQDSTHMVIVVDEYGNTAGLATMEDLVEVIVGEIRDEHEPDQRCRRGRPGRLHRLRQFRSGARLSDLFEFPPGEDIESTTVGGLVTMAGPRAAPGEVGGARRHPRRGAGQRRTARGAGPHQQVADGSIMNKSFQFGLRLASSGGPTPANRRC